MIGPPSKPSWRDRPRIEFAACSTSRGTISGTSASIAGTKKELAAPKMAAAT